MMRIPIVLCALVALLAIMAGCATPAPRPATVERVEATADYFGPGVVLAGHRQHSYETSLYDIPFYPAVVVTAASAATKDEAKVKVARTGEELWTAYLLPSRPADKELLAVGTFVLYAGDADPRTPEDLTAISEWRFGRVKDVSGLYKDVVVVEYLDGYWNEWKQWDIHVRNLRLVTTEVEPGF